MKMKRLLLIILISLLFASTTFITASANDIEPPIPSPECGTYTDTRDGPGTFGNYTAAWYVPDVSVIITSTNGWYIVEASWLDEGKATIITHTYFPETPTVSIVDYPAGASWLSVTLKKKCVCEPTGRFVYTLFGDYPCNLITDEASIPARFLNPEYTAPLCKLPDADHNWNGEWVKSKEYNCGGYFKGGNHYDTSK